MEFESLVGVVASREPGRWAERQREEKQRVLRIEFKTFVNAFTRLPCQIIRAGPRSLRGKKPQGDRLFKRLADVSSKSRPGSGFGNLR